MTDRSEFDEDKENYEVEKNENIVALRERIKRVTSFADHHHRSSLRFL